VVYNGVRGGDFLNIEQVRALQSEIATFSGLHRTNPLEEQMVQNFEIQMQELVRASLAVCKPIAF
jgi:hypothetical protein